MTITLYLAIGECSHESHTCSANASCIRALGNDICSCPLGYTGDGTICTGYDAKKQLYLKKQPPLINFKKESYAKKFLDIAKVTPLKILSLYL